MAIQKKYPYKIRIDTEYDSLEMTTAGWDDLFELLDYMVERAVGHRKTGYEIYFYYKSSLNRSDDDTNSET